LTGDSELIPVKDDHDHGFLVKIIDYLRQFIISGLRRGRRLLRLLGTAEHALSAHSGGFAGWIRGVRRMGGRVKRTLDYWRSFLNMRTRDGLGSRDRLEIEVMYSADTDTDN
jgi:hypothetical protein